MTGGKFKALYQAYTQIRLTRIRIYILDHDNLGGSVKKACRNKVLT